MERIAKVIAASGLCSRREAERWIEQGRVKVDGVKLTTPAVTVSPEQEIVVDGKALAKPKAVQMWKFHKPKGAITSRKDEKDRQTVFDLLPPEMRNLHTVGRLDYNSEGLLLLTNSPTVKRYLELPDTEWVRHYRVRVHGVPAPQVLKQLAAGVTIEGMRYKGIEVAISGAGKEASNVWLEVKLREGKNREIRKVFVHFGHPVSRLIRTGYGPFQLAKLPIGQIEELRFSQIRESLPRSILEPGK